MVNLLEYKGYHAKVEIDSSDKIFVGKVIGVNDVLAFHGTSYDELEEMFHQSIDNYLDMCEFFGKEPDKEYKGSFNVRISPELHKKVDLAARNDGLTLNQYISRAIEDSIETKPKRETIVCMLPTEAIKKSFNAQIDFHKYIDIEKENFMSTKEMTLS